MWDGRNNPLSFQTSRNRSLLHIVLGLGHYTFEVHWISAKRHIFLACHIWTSLSLCSFMYMIHLDITWFLKKLKVCSNDTTRTSCLFVLASVSFCFSSFEIVLRISSKSPGEWALQNLFMSSGLKRNSDFSLLFSAFWNCFTKVSKSLWSGIIN